jgi:TetR/AcrR family transcriptional regulator, ethionamide resistance regulator
MATVTRRDPSKRAAVEASVLAATEALLAEGRTFAELPVEEIARRAGMSRPAFYFYFRDKSDLLMRLTEDGAAELEVAARAWWDEARAAGLRPALERVLRIYRDHGVLLRAVVETSAYDPTVAEFWRAVVDRFVEGNRRTFAAEQEAGRMPPFAAQETAFALCWMLERACYQRLVRGEDMLVEEFVSALAGVWERALYGGLTA